MSGYFSLEVILLDVLVFKIFFAVIRRCGMRMYVSCEAVGSLQPLYARRAGPDSVVLGAEKL
jgi:hypothetical protein